MQGPSLVRAMQNGWCAFCLTLFLIPESKHLAVHCRQVPYQCESNQRCTRFLKWIKQFHTYSILSSSKFF